MMDQAKKYWQKHKQLAVFMALIVVGLIIFFPYLFPSRALVTEVYSNRCAGDWFGPDRVIGPPEVSSSGSFSDFNTENSAFYQYGFQSILCDLFEITEEGKQNKKFISARLGLSLAINEIFAEIQEMSASSPTSSSENLLEEQAPEEELNQNNEQKEKQEKENDRGEEKNKEKENIKEEPKQNNQEEILEEEANDEQLLMFLLNQLFVRPNWLNIFPVFAQEEEQNQEQEQGTGKDIEEIIEQENEEEIVDEQLNQEKEFFIEEDEKEGEEEPKNKEESEIIIFLDDLIEKIENDLTPVFLPPDLIIETDSFSTSSPETINNQVDAILNLRYSLADNNYQLGTFANYPISPAINHGYFYFDLPEIKSFDDLEKIKVSLEGLLAGDPKLISYLDSLWIEVIYEDEPAEIVPPTLEMEKNTWRSDEEPIIKINSQPNHLVKADSFKKSLIKKLGIFPAEEQIELFLVDSGNQEIALDLDKDFKIEEVNNLSQIKLLRPRSFRPGHYKLKFKIQQNGESAEVVYDFQWGVLAINTNKSIYLSSEALAKEGLPPESAYLQMAALNDLGNTLCDANLRLSVIYETSGQETIFTTVDKSIEKSGRCNANNVVDVPDYFVHYQVGEVGKYDLTLINLDNNYQITDSFVVQDSLPYEVERIGPTRIYPLANYQMTFRIKTNQDFTGLITEIVPSSFQIVSVNLEQAGQARVEYPRINQIEHEKINNFLTKKKNSWNEQNDEEKKISWQVNWQAGQSYELKYEFDAPDISPYLYLLGPLAIGDWQEARNWQIASDAIVYIQTANATGIGSASAMFDNGVTVNNMIIAICAADQIGQLSIANFSTAIDQSNMPFIPPAQAIFYKVATVEDTANLAISCISASPTVIVGLHIYEYRGLATSLPVDDTGSRTGSDSDPNSGDINVISSADRLLIAGVTYLADVLGFSSWSNSFTERNDFKDNDPGSITFGGADLVVNAPGIYSTTATRGVPMLGAWRGQIVSFKITTGITVYGTIYSDEGLTPLDCAMIGSPYPTITLKVNGLGSYSGPCITSQGTFAIPGVAIGSFDDVVTAYIDGATQKGVAVTKAADTTSDINLNIYQDRLIVRHEGATSITNTDLGQWDKNDDDDIHFTSNQEGAPGIFDLTVDNDTELHIWTGKTFAPGGAVTINPGGTSPGSDLHIDDNGTFIAGDAISIGGNWTADSNSTFTHNNYSVTFTATAPGKIIAANSQSFYDVIFNGDDGGWSFSSTTTISNDLTMTTGTLSGTASINVNGGDVIGNATINLTGGTFTLDGAGNFGGTTAWNFNNLTFGDDSDTTTSTATGAGDITVDSVLTIAANQTLDAGSKTWTLFGTSGMPFVKTGTFTPNASTFVYSGDNSSGSTTITATTYNHLTLNDTNDPTETYVLAGTTNLNGDLTITVGILDVTASNYALNVKGSWTNAGTFTAQSGAVTFNGTASGKTIKTGSSSFWILTFNGSGGAWTLQTNNLDVNDNLNITTGTLNASTLSINLAGNLAIGANGIFIKGSGIFTFDKNNPTPATWTDETSGKQDLGTTIIDGVETVVELGSSVKATKINIGADDTLNLGTNSYTLTLTGSGTGVNKPLTIETGGTLTIGDSTVEYTSDSTTDVTRSASWNYYNLKVNGTGSFTAEVGTLTIDNNLDVTAGTFSLGGATAVTNDLTIGSSGTLDVVLDSNYALTVTGSWTINSPSGTFNARAGLVTFNSAGSETITTNNQAFYQLTFNNVTGSWTLQDALDVNNTFNLTNGTLAQAANNNINFGGNTTFSLDTTFTKASGTGQVIFDGSDAKFTDNTVVKQNLGNVEVGASPDDVTLCSNSTMDSLEVNGGDTYYLNNWAIDVTNSISVNSTGTLDASTDRSMLCPPGTGVLINLETDWTVDSDGAFLAGSSTVTFDGPADKSSNIDSGGTDDNHDFYNFTFAKTYVAIGATSSLTNNLKVSNDFNLSTADSYLATNNRSINVGGNWANSGYFDVGWSTVTFDAGSTGKTIDSGGTGGGKKFYNIIFNNAAGGWHMVNNNLTATNNFSITNADTFNAANLTITVNGNFTNLVGGTATTWTDSTLNLTKTGGGSYTINTKSAGSDIYGTLIIGANTDPRIWNSSASTYTVNASGSLYSMDHATIDGELYLWGDYHTGYATTTDYWSYATDFDGEELITPRQVSVYLATTTSVTVDEDSTLNVIGGGSNSNDITIVGQSASAPWDFACNGTCNIQESTWNHLNLTGGTLTVYNTTLNNEDTPDAGILNVDWYLGVLVKDAAGEPVDTGDNDITISENSSSPTSTVFVWSGDDWSDGAISQTTGTDENGKIPQPGTNGAIKIREYSWTSEGYTFYKYNIKIDFESSSYDYYENQGENYITSSLNYESGEDECISESWLRADIDVQNVPEQEVDEPPTNGTWYNQLTSGLVFEISDYSLEFSLLIPGGNPTSTAHTLTITCSAANGFVIYAWSSQAMTHTIGSETISDWNGTNEIPTEWENGYYGFGYHTDDENLVGPGNPNRFVGPKFAGLVHTGPGDPVANETGPVSNTSFLITYQIAVETSQRAGTYTTIINYVIVPNY